MTDGVYSHQASDIRIATESVTKERLLKLQKERGAGSPGLYERKSMTKKTRKKKKLTLGH